MGLEFQVNLCFHIRAGRVCVCLVHEESDKEIPHLMIMSEHMNYLLANGVWISGESLFVY